MKSTNNKQPISETFVWYVFFGSAGLFSRQDLDKMLAEGLVENAVPRMFHLRVSPVFPFNFRYLVLLLLAQTVLGIFNSFQIDEWRRPQCTCFFVSGAGSLNVDS